MLLNLPPLLFARIFKEFKVKGYVWLVIKRVRYRKTIIPVYKFYGIYAPCLLIPCYFADSFLGVLKNRVEFWLGINLLRPKTTAIPVGFLRIRAAWLVKP